jgi:hypothetical protein
MGVSDEAKNVIPLKFLRKIKNKNFFPLVNSIRGHTVYCVAKCEKENGQIIIIQRIGIAMKTCVVFNIIAKKIKLKHSNLISQILP